MRKLQLEVHAAQTAKALSVLRQG